MAEGAKKTDRKNQPRCGTGRKTGCAHPISFHGGGKTHCKALGCTCKKWVMPKRQVEDPAGQVAQTPA